MKNFIYSVSCLAFAIIIGGAVYEHLNVVPTWSAAPPVSLNMFQGDYGLKAELFWMIIHPVNLLLFIISLAMHWRSERRKNISIVFGTYVGILIITSIYFVPELISIITTPYSTVINPELTSRAKLWEMLSLVRLAVLLILSVYLFNGLTRSSSFSDSSS